VAKDLVTDFLEVNDIKFVPQKDALDLVRKLSNREANALTHIFSELGWKKKRFAWSGKMQQWAWHHPDYKPEQGQISAILRVEDDLGEIHEHLAKTLYPAMLKLLGHKASSDEATEK
jgi:hypothetical protein